MKHAVLALLLGAIAALALADSPRPVTLTGWFACNKCTAARVADGDVRPSNPECARQCIEKGDNPVFLDEQGKRSLRVNNYPSAKDDLGYHVEVTGRVDSASSSIVVERVKKLDYVGASCARRPKETKQ